jgi:hypothetical protein
MTSVIPAVIDALISAVEAALPGVQVIDGPPITQDLQDQVVFIGWSQARPSTAISEIDATFHASGITEDFQIPCQARDYSGDGDMAACRTGVFTLLDAVESAALTLAPAGVNCLVHVTAVTYTPQRVQSGTQASVDFTVAVSALE